MSGRGSGSGEGSDQRKTYPKKDMKGWAYIDEDDGADVTDLYTRDERKNRPKNKMVGWAYVDDDDDGADATHLHTSEPTARSRREAERANRDRRDRERANYDDDANGDTVMGGTDDSNEPYPRGSMNDPLPGSAAALPTPPNLAGLPPPDQPNTLIPVPRPAGGRADRRRLNTDPNMWWNQYGQDRTNPPSDNCYECASSHKTCDLFERGYPCTRCQQKGSYCKNGTPSQKWEQRQILAQTGVVVEIARQAGGRAMGLGNRGRSRSEAATLLLESEGGDGRERQSAASSMLGRTDRIGRPYNVSSRSERVDRRERPGADSSSPQSNKSGDSTLGTIVVDGRPNVASSRPERNERPRRVRSASPERDDDEDDDEEDDDDGDGDDGSSLPNRSGRSQKKRQYKRRKPVPLTDEMYEKKFGMKRKCKECTRMRVTCPGGRPCDRCTRMGRVCEPVHNTGVPYAVQGPPPNDDDYGDEDEDDGAVASSSRRAGPGRQRRRQQGQRNAPPAPDPFEQVWAQFNGLFNPFNYRRHEMEEIGIGVPTAARMGPLAVVPPLWHHQRNVRVRDAQRYAQQCIQQDIERSMGNLGPGMGFGGTAEVAHRPRWDEQAAQATWYTNDSSRDVPPVVRPEPEPYNVNRPSDPMPDFGRNMVNVGLSLNSEVPPPPHGEQIPWIATWNFEGQGQTETRGPLGWPYPTIDPLDAGHKHNTPGYFDPVNCCENANRFSRGFAPYAACNVNPALMCEVLPEYDRDHERNPWHTCNVCRYKQWDFYDRKQQETLLRQKLYACEICADQIRKEGRSWPKECLCYATKTCRDLCHLHREKIENAADGPILIAEDYLIRSNILRLEWDKCINCGVEDANPFSDVWSCKLCREWVQDSGRRWIDRRRP